MTSGHRMVVAACLLLPCTVGCDLVSPHSAAVHDIGGGGDLRGLDGANDGVVAADTRQTDVLLGTDVDTVTDLPQTPDAGPDLAPDIAADLAPDVASDLPPPDIAADIAPDLPPDTVPDLPPPDIAPDLPPDVAVDLPPPDIAPDLPPPDIAPDLPPPDIAPDVATDLTPDQAADVLVPPACHPANAVAEHVIDDQMVFCVSTDDAVAFNQCEAEQNLCNTAEGWALCTASAYKQRFSSSTPPVDYAWVAGCIREALDPFAPTDAVCSACQAVETLMKDIGWSCDGTKVLSKGKPMQLGIASDPFCRRLGINDPSTAAYWQPEAAANPLQRAVCCAP